MFLERMMLFPVRLQRANSIHEAGTGHLNACVQAATQHGRTACIEIVFHG
jgi:hypothetical protein